jgi:hypothetical protein
VADGNAIVLDAASWVDPAAWAKAPEHARSRYLKRCGELAIARKRGELRRGLGVDGKPLAAVKPSSRPDHATGKPLDPHYGASRSVRLIRAHVGARGGTVTLAWSHGFGRILGYHAAGTVPGAPVRDVLGLTQASERWIKAEARAFWRNLTTHHGVVRLPGAPGAAPAPLQRPRPLPMRPARRAALPAP